MGSFLMHRCVVAQLTTKTNNRFGRAGDLARMQKVYDRMRQEEIRPTAQTYTALIEAFTKHGAPFLRL